MFQQSTSIWSTYSRKSVERHDVKNIKRWYKDFETLLAAKGVLEVMSTKGSKHASVATSNSYGGFFQPLQSSNNANTKSSATAAPFLCSPTAPEITTT